MPGEPPALDTYEPAPLDVDHHLRVELTDPRTAVCPTLDQLQARLAEVRAAGVPGTARVSGDRGPLQGLHLDWTSPPLPVTARPLLDRLRRRPR